MIRGVGAGVAVFVFCFVALSSPPAVYAVLVGAFAVSGVVSARLSSRRGADGRAVTAAFALGALVLALVTVRVSEWDGALGGFAAVMFGGAMRWGIEAAASSPRAANHPLT